MILLLFLSHFVQAGLPPAEGWTPRPTPVGYWTDLALSADGRVAVAAGGPGRQGEFALALSISTNSGRSWQGSGFAKQFPTSPVTHLAVSADGIQIVAAGIGAVWISTDQGNHWRTILTLPLDELGDPVGDVQISRDGQRIVVTGSGGLHSTSDLGTNWVFSPFPAETPERTETAATTLGMSANGRTVMAAVLSRLPLISRDFGSTWRRVELQGVDAHVVEFGPAALAGDGEHLAMVVRIEPPGQQGQNWPTNTIEVLTSSNGGETWKRTSTALQNDEEDNWGNFNMGNSLAMSDDGQHFVFGTYIGGMGAGPGPNVISSDSGQTWRRLDMGYANWVSMSGSGHIQAAAVVVVRSIFGAPPGPFLSFGVAYPPEISEVGKTGDMTSADTSAVSLSVRATGGLLSYEWRKDGVPLLDGPNRDGIGTRQLAISPVTVADLGTYSVIVSNSEGSVEREVGRIEITAPQVLGVSQVGGPALIDGAPVTFSVQAQGGLLSYQWQRNGLALADGPGFSGVHTPELKLPVTTDGDLGTYTVAISNPLGIVTTNVGVLQLTVPKVLGTRQVGGPMIQLGDSSQLEFNAEGGQVDVEWLRNGLPLGTAGIWTGPGVNQLVLTNLVAEDLGEYSVRLRNSVGESIFVIGRVSQAAWVKANVASESWNSVALSQDGRRLIATSPSQIVASANGGETWATLAAPGTDWTSVALGTESGRVLLGQGNDPIVSNQPTSWVISGDSGTTWTSWTDLGNGQDERGIWRTKAAACSSDGMTLLLSQDNTVTLRGRLPLPLPISRLRISRDGGLTWQTASTNPSDNRWRSVSCSLDGTSMAAIRGLHFFDPFTPWVYQIYYSPNSGATWRSTTLPEPSIRSVRVSGDGRRLIAIGEKGMYACNTESLSWVKLPAPQLAWNAISVSEDGQRILTADYGSADAGGRVYQSSDGGQTWRWTGSPSANWTAIACSADGERVVGVSPQGIFLSPVANPAPPSAVPAQIGSDTSGVHMVWQGTPHRTYRIISTPGLDGQAWQSVGAAVADGEGRVSLAEPAIEAQRFWKALEVE